MKKKKRFALQYQRNSIAKKARKLSCVAHQTGLNIENNNNMSDSKQQQQQQQPEEMESGETSGWTANTGPIPKRARSNTKPKKALDENNKPSKRKQRPVIVSEEAVMQILHEARADEAEEAVQEGDKVQNTATIDDETLSKKKRAIAVPSKKRFPYRTQTLNKLMEILDLFLCINLSPDEKTEKFLSQKEVWKMQYENAKAELDFNETEQAPPSSGRNEKVLSQVREFFDDYGLKYLENAFASKLKFK